MVAGLALGALLAGAGPSIGGRAPESVELVLARQYSRALYRECRLDISLSRQSPSRAALRCAINIEPERSLTADRDLAAEETASLFALVDASALCGGGGEPGRDGRSVDGVLETLTTTCPDRRVTVLVTSRNPAFGANDARRRLLERLHALEDELRRSARQPR